MGETLQPTDAPLREPGFDAPSQGPASPRPDALAGSQRLFQAIFEQTLDGIILVDDAARVVDANPAMCRLLGYSREELLKINAADLAPLPNREQVPDRLRRFLSTGFQSGESTLLCKDGTTREVEFNAVANVLPGVHLAVHRDVTRRRRAENELRDREARLQLVIHQLPGAIWTTDRDLRMASVQGMAAENMGVNARDMLGKPICEFVEPDSHVVAESAHRQALRGESVSYECVCFGHSFQCYLEPLRDSAGAIIGCLGIALEITQQKRTEEKLREYAERSQDLSRRLVEIQETERRRLARELHDEIGQILTAILYNLQAAKSAGMADGMQRLEVTIGIVDRAIQQVRRLSLDLRPPMLDDLGLPATLRWYVESLAERTGLAVYLVAPPLGTDLPVDVKNAVFRIAQEALTNAVRHSQAEQVWVTLHANREEVSLVILDNGVGFDVSAAQERAAEGNSFGILGMRERVDMLDGRFAVVSRPGQGTAVEVHLPLTSEDQSEEAAAETRSER